jgi:hypothetical protein
MPGKLSALLSRFQKHTLRIWEKHGIRQVGFWTTLIGRSSQEITYMLAWDSMAEREKRWGIRSLPLNYREGDAAPSTPTSRAQHHLSSHLIIMLTMGGIFFGLGGPQLKAAQGA